jgi:hypothetical protein
MALMNCPECAKEISDKSTVCIHCGYPLDTMQSVTEQHPPARQPINLDADQPISSGRAFNRRMWFAVFGIVLVLLVGGGVGWNVYVAQQAKLSQEAYQNGGHELLTDMLDTMVLAEKMANLNINVWHDAIYREDTPATEKYVWQSGYGHVDFETALLNLALDPDIQKQRTAITDGKTSAQAAMKTLVPTTDQTATQQKLLELYALFEEFTSLATEPTGSYNTYTEQVATTKASFLRLFNELKILLPE